MKLQTPRTIPPYYQRLLKVHNLSGVNRPKRTPSHPTKSHIVLAYHDGVFRLIRFGAQGAKTYPPRKGESERDRRKRAAFKARHRENIRRGPLSAAFWADLIKW